MEVYLHSESSSRPMDHVMGCQVSVTDRLKLHIVCRLCFIGNLATLFNCTIPSRNKPLIRQFETLDWKPLFTIVFRSKQQALTAKM